jgi:hypothetical protein
MLLRSSAPSADTLYSTGYVPAEPVALGTPTLLLLLPGSWRLGSVMAVESGKQDTLG